MPTPTITIPVDEPTAEAYATASDQDKRKIELLLSLRLRELTQLPSAGLNAVMDRMADDAAARGLNPSNLESLLKHG
jgi:hypothetical protein